MTDQRIPVASMLVVIFAKQIIINKAIISFQPLFQTKYKYFLKNIC